MLKRERMPLAALTTTLLSCSVLTMESVTVVSACAMACDAACKARNDNVKSLYLYVVGIYIDSKIIIHLLSYPHLLLAARISKVYLYIFKSKLTSAGFNAHS